jgi:hypothetical protein
MKKTILLILCCTAFSLYSQTNFQVHYDFGQGRKYVTTTVEMFKVDKWGDTFLFIDIDYNGSANHYPSMAYMEIARCLRFWDAPFSAQIEYNGGLTSAANAYIPINHAFLAGADYGWHSADFTKFLNFKILYKYIYEKNPLSFQLTAVWNLHFFNKKLTLSGFADFWHEDNTNFTDARGNTIAPTDTKFVFITEPQIWYNVTEHFSLGSEIEIADNFGAVKGLKVCPTLAVKWNF